MIESSAARKSPPHARFRLVPALSSSHKAGKVRGKFGGGFDLRTTYLTLLAIGLAGFATAANAQYYSQSPYARSPYARGPYPAELADNNNMGEPTYASPQGTARPSASRAYESQPLPPPGTTYPPSTAYQAPAATQPQPPAAGQPQALQPPTATYPSASQQPAYGQQPVYGRPPAYAPPREAYGYPGAAPGTRPAAGPSYGFEPLRPPGEIGASTAPSYAPAPPPGSVPASNDVPTGSITASRTPATSASERRAYASLPPDYRPEEGKPKQLSPRFQRQIVDYTTTEPAGTLVVDTPNTFLYLVLANGKALRYGIGVGREGFTWSGVERVTKMAEWPDWHPPKEMIERQPYLPRFMAGGESSPLGARALYLGKTIYRIHGTNQPSTIGTFVSSGCIRLTNEDVQDLYQRVQVGTRVVVLPKNSNGEAKKGAAPSSSAQMPTSSQVIR